MLYRAHIMYQTKDFGCLFIEALKIIKNVGPKTCGAPDY